MCLPQGFGSGTEEVAQTLVPFPEHQEFAERKQRLLAVEKAASWMVVAVGSLLLVGQVD